MGDPFADAVIVAAGSSQRMGGIDKLTEPLLGRPLLGWSVDAMARAQSVRRIIVVAQPEKVEMLRSADWLVDLATDRVTVVAGGDRRSDSVRAGLDATEAPVVLVHDGARPLATPALADAVARAAAEHGAAVPVLPVVDSLKHVADEEIGGSIDRAGLVRTQTPQGARRELLLDGFEAADPDAAYSDEAALLEARGVRVVTVPGEATNLKVTDQADLDIVRSIVAGRAAADPAGGGLVRFGFGQDSHGFGPGDGLMLGGVLIADAPRLYGHSDGDVVLHALATGILAACGLGDLGRLFPSTDPQTEGVSSAALLANVLDRAEDVGWRVERAQLAILGSRPRLGAARLDEIGLRLAELIDLPMEAVAVTASTGNLNGAEGAGRVVSATALVAVVRR